MGLNQSNSSIDQGDNREENDKGQVKKWQRKSIPSAHGVKTGHRKTRPKALGAVVRGKRKRKNYQESTNEDENDSNKASIPITLVLIWLWLYLHPVSRGSSAVYSTNDAQPWLDSESHWYFGPIKSLSTILTLHFEIKVVDNNLYSNFLVSFHDASHACITTPMIDFREYIHVSIPSCSLWCLIPAQ